MTWGIQNPLIYGSAASFVYKCFLPGPTERLKKLRFVGRMSDQYNVIIFPSIIYLVLLIATHKYKPRSRAWVRGCLHPLNNTQHLSALQTWTQSCLKHFLPPRRLWSH